PGPSRSRCDTCREGGPVAAGPTLASDPATHACYVLHLTLVVAPLAVPYLQLADKWRNRPNGINRSADSNPGVNLSLGRIAPENAVAFAHRHCSILPTC